MSDWERVSPNCPDTCDAPAPDSVVRPIADRTYCGEKAVLYFLPGGFRGDGEFIFGAFAICVKHNVWNKIYQDEIQNSDDEGYARELAIDAQCEGYDEPGDIDSDMDYDPYAGQVVFENDTSHESDFGDWG
jgi:hypothetical protein